MEFSAEEKAQIEAPLKMAMKSLLDAMEVAASVAAKHSENKVDDVLVPMMAPAAKAVLLQMIDGMKL
jgi:hypothetical protein